VFTFSLSSFLMSICSSGPGCTSVICKQFTQLTGLHFVTIWNVNGRGSDFKVATGSAR
jgi:hypothetical protein